MKNETTSYKSNRPSIMKKYKDLQYDRVERLLNETDIFNGDKGNGKFKSGFYPFVLANENNNLFSLFAKEIKDYMNHYKAFWNGALTNHTLSSQVACLNHLFPIRKDKNAVLCVAKVIDDSIDDVFEIPTDDFMSAYIQFEAVSYKDRLEEGKPNRGANCTSVDALIYGVRKDGTRVILPIEWKYVEAYGNKRLFDEVTYRRDGSEAVNKKGLTKGKERQRRYFDLIEKSTQLKPVTKTISNFEPFYQLMRQTLWAEQMIKNAETETIKASDFIHAHVIPKENNELLNKEYDVSNKRMRMEETWKECLTDQAKYKIIQPKDLLAGIDKTKYADLIKYLQTRYW
jgi:hypothetical protein